MSNSTEERLVLLIFNIFCKAFFEHAIFKTFQEALFLETEVLVGLVQKRGVNSFVYNFPFLKLRMKLRPDFLFEFCVIDTHMFISVLFESFKVFDSKGCFKVLCTHRIQNAKSFGIIR